MPMYLKNLICSYYLRFVFKIWLDFNFINVKSGIYWERKQSHSKHDVSWDIWNWLVVLFQDSNQFLYFRRQLSVIIYIMILLGKVKKKKRNQFWVGEIYFHWERKGDLWWEIIILIRHHTFSLLKILFVFTRYRIFYPQS